MNETLMRKTIQIQLEVTSGSSNYDLCVAIETLISSTILNAAEFNLAFIETKVIKDIPYVEEKHSDVGTTV